MSALCAVINCLRAALVEGDEREGDERTRLTPCLSWSIFSVARFACNEAESELEGEKLRDEAEMRQSMLSLLVTSSDLLSAIYSQTILTFLPPEDFDVSPSSPRRRLGLALALNGDEPVAYKMLTSSLAHQLTCSPLISLMTGLGSRRIGSSGACIAQPLSLLKRTTFNIQR